MATRMKLKLKTVFVLYFMVSLLGLVYALMQLGKWLIHSLHPGFIIRTINCTCVSPSETTTLKMTDSLYCDCQQK